jgi:hypothetical protein
MQNQNHLKFTNTKNLKFSFTKEGLIASYKKKKFILGMTIISKDDVIINDEEFASMAEATLKFHCSVRNVPLHLIDNRKSISQKAFNDYSPFYKYVSDETYEKYISKGIFQLGNIEQYRNIENKKQRDEFEGHSFLNLNINNHIVSSICSSGFNYLIFCGTKKKNSIELKEQFGNKELYFPNPKQFAETISKTINARSYFIQNVEYNTLKLYINKDKIINSKINLNQILSAEYFEILKEHLLYPSLYVKPGTFKNENEVRIVFEMPKDQFKPYRFENKELLKHIK